MKKNKWIQKCDVDAAQDKNLPIPTQIISNEEFVPPEQTEEQKKVEHRLNEIDSERSKLLGINRRKFLASTGWMAAVVLSMNLVFGKFFNVDESEIYETAASDEKLPKTSFIFDIHTHHVGAGKIIKVAALLQYREVAGVWGIK